MGRPFSAIIPVAMPSERTQRRIDRLLDQAEEAADREDWSSVQRLAEQVLALDPDSEDAPPLLRASQVGLRRVSAGESSLATPDAEPAAARESAAPTSFAGGRYIVERFLGEGSKKRVYLAHDELLDRDVAFALIKTEGLDEVGRERIAREAQAMGRLGTHAHVVSVFDLGQRGLAP